MENNKNTIFDNLNLKSKERIMMYTTARQFKNAVPIEEMLIIPSKIDDWIYYSDIRLNNAKLQDLITTYGIKDNSPIIQNGITMVTARGTKIISKQSPFIVNKSFACEVYLKLILEENNIEWKDLKGKEGHNLWKLYSKMPNTLKKDLNKVMLSKGFTIIDAKIKKISTAFINWRYIYQNYKENVSLDFIFLNEFCNYLDTIAKTIILKTYNYDVDKDTR